MPEMNGFEATEYIRNTIKSSIPIIALTADVTTVDLEKCKLVGMNDYLPKPVDEKLLHSKIVSLLTKPKLIKVTDNVEENENSIEKIRYVDLAYLNRRTKSNPVLMMEMISIYLEQTPALLTTIKESLEQENWTLLGAAVHKMLPSFAIMGINPDFENLAKKIHDFAIAQEKDESIKDLVTQLEKICVNACSELEEEYNSMKNGKKLIS